MHRDMATAQRDLALPMFLRNVFDGEKVIERISLKIISTLREMEEPGVSVLTNNVLETLPWNTGMFLTDLGEGEPNNWLFCSSLKVPGNGTVNWEAQTKKGKLADEWMFRRYTPFPRLSKDWELSRFSSPHIPGEAVYNMNMIHNW